MKHTMHIAIFPHVGLLAAAAILGAATPAAAVHGEHTVMPADSVQWGAAPSSLPPGAQASAIHGSPSKEGPFVLRLKFPAGFVVPPHRHSKDELVTVISGRIAIQSGDKVDRASLKPVPAGSFVHIPGGTAHYAWAEVETVVQINGVGPFDVSYVDPNDDPRSN
jgi:quercetin dioxygenase-like cupin family protein